MRILATFPGRYGDLLWALPTIRALSRRVEAPVDLAIAGEFAPIIPLLERQDYLGQVHPIPTWGLSQGWEPPALRSPEVADPYDHTVHLGYRRWPEYPLALETLWTFNRQGDVPLGVQDLALHEPWITHLPAAPPTEIAIGFSECHFELKVGLVTLLEDLDRPLLVLNHDSRTRWALERPRGGYPLTLPSPWQTMAGIIRNADLFLGCCSGLHVLAVAIGIPVVIVEPMEARWNPIFYPVGMDGPQVRVVKGLDGKPTFDARHVREVIEGVLQGEARR
jgi:hypothetical protein